MRPAPFSVLIYCLLAVSGRSETHEPVPAPAVPSHHRQCPASIRIALAQHPDAHPCASVQSGQASVNFVREASRRLAIKTFRTREDYENEATILADLQECPFILQPLCVLADLQQIVYEEIRDGDLLDLAVDGLSYADLAQIALQVVRAVDTIHRRGYLHMDVKPENIVRDGVRVWLIDFGLASPLSRAPRDIGTPRTMSPEALLPAAQWMPISRASDWWSVGVTLFYVFSRYFKLPPHCHFKNFPYRVLYDDRDDPADLQWAPLPPLPFPPDLFSLLFGRHGLLSPHYEHRQWDGQQLLAHHPFFHAPSHHAASPLAGGKE